MSKRFIVLFFLLLFLLGIVLVGRSYFLHTKKNSNIIVLYGNVDVRQVDIGFRVPGRVDRLFFEEGDVVTKDVLMATLEKTPYDKQLAQAEANANAVRVNLENASKLLKRRQELVGIGGVSQEDLDNAQMTEAQLRATLASAEAAVAVARDNLIYTEVFAPTEGVILTRIREPGSVVRESDPVYTLSVTSPVWIRAFVDEPHLGQVYYGMPAEVFTDTPEGKVYKGKVGFISPVSEFTPKTVETTQLRTDLVYRLRIYVDNPDHGLRQGMPVTVKLHINPSANETERSSREEAQ
jgi:HlyD family secretion protein